MASIINVLVAIDSDSILAKYGPNTSKDNPPFISGSNLIFMITEQDNVVSGQAGNELCIKGVPGDTVRWRETTLALNPNTDVLLYGFEATQGQGLFTDPVAVEPATIIALPNKDNVYAPKLEKITTYYWTSDLLDVGNVTYHFKFMILNAAGQVKGYYQWDPFIQISFTDNNNKIEQPITV